MFLTGHDADSVLRPFSDLVSAPLGGHILAVSDEWFAPASNLLKPEKPIYSEKQVYTGQWMDGWETRRHNRNAFDYTIIRLGVASGTVVGVEIDTAYFEGNEAPAVSVEGCFRDDDDEVVGWQGGRGGWDVIMSKQACQPSTRHAWRLSSPSDTPYTHVRLNMYPDGGIARFRLYGHARPLSPADPATVFDVASARNGGLAVACSNQAFGTLASNLLLPGRGPDMADGWETARSRTEDHVDWAIVRLAVPGNIGRMVVDTIHFRGNYPDEIQVAGINWIEDGVPDADHMGWTTLTTKVDGQADTEHELDSQVKDRIFTHVKLSIWPDGGVKRLRVFGTRAV